MAMIAIPVKLYFDDDVKKPDKKTPPPPLPTPINTKDPNETGKKVTANNTDKEEAEELQKPILAEKFRMFCGNSEGNEARTEHLEHHVGSLIIKRKTAEERENARDGEVRELRGEVEELNIMMKRAPKIEKITELQKIVNSNTDKTDQNTKQIDEIDQETKGIHLEFKIFVLKAEAAMNSQTDAAKGTKQQLELLMQQITRNSGRTEATYAQKETSRHEDLRVERENT